MTQELSGLAQSPAQAAWWSKGSVSTITLSSSPTTHWCIIFLQGVEAFLGYTAVEGGSWERNKFFWKITCFLWWESLFWGRYLWGWCLPLITPGPRPRTLEAHERMRRVSAPHRWHLLINIFSLTSRPAWLRTPRCVLGRRMVRIKILHQYWYLVPALFSSVLYSCAQFSCFKGKGLWCLDYLHALVWAMSCL